jgi:hypothetical protein
VLGDGNIIATADSDVDGIHKPNFAHRLLAELLRRSFLVATMVRSSFGAGDLLTSASAKASPWHCYRWPLASTLPGILFILICAATFLFHDFIVDNASRYISTSSIRTKSDVFRVFTN